MVVSTVIGVILAVCLIFYIVGRIKQKLELKEAKQTREENRIEHLRKLNNYVDYSRNTTESKKRETQAVSASYVYDSEPYTPRSYHSEDHDVTQTSHFSNGFGGGGFSGSGAGSSWEDSYSSSSDSSSCDSGSSDSSSSSD